MDETSSQKIEAALAESLTRSLTGVCARDATASKKDEDS